MDTSIKKTLDKLSGPLFIVPALIFFVPFTLFPTLGTLYFVFFKWSGTGLHTREFIGLDNYLNLFQDPVFFTAIKNNFTFGVFIVGGQILLGLVLALILADGGKFFSVFQVIYMIPLTLSFIVISVLASILFSPTFNVLNELLTKMGLGFLSNLWLGDIKMTRWIIIFVSIWKGFGFSMLLFIARIRQIPQELYDAAMVDGAGFFRRTLHITLPQLRQVAVVVLMLEIINAFRFFDVVFTLTEGGPFNVTQVMATYSYLSGFYYNRMGYGTAISSILLLIAGLITAAQLKFIWRPEEL